MNMHRYFPVDLNTLMYMHMYMLKPCADRVMLGPEASDKDNDTDKQN